MSSGPRTTGTPSFSAGTVEIARAQARDDHAVGAARPVEPARDHLGAHERRHADPDVEDLIAELGALQRPEDPAEPRLGQLAGQEQEPLRHGLRRTLRGSTPRAGTFGTRPGRGPGVFARIAPRSTDSLPQCAYTYSAPPRVAASRNGAATAATAPACAGARSNSPPSRSRARPRRIRPTAMPRIAAILSGFGSKTSIPGRTSSTRRVSGTSRRTSGTTRRRTAHSWTARSGPTTGR